MLNIRHLYGRLVPHTLTWSFCVKAEVKLAGLLLRSVPLVFGRLTSSLVKVTWGYARNVRRMYTRQGSKGLAIYLKACYVLLQHSAGGMVDASPWALGANVSTTRKGIPRIINPQHRSLIVKGDIAIIRFWLTLFGLYRVIEFKGALKLQTITKPGVDISQFMVDWNSWIPDFYSRARLITADEWKLDPSKHLYPRLIPFIRKAAPNSGGFSSVMAIPWDIAIFLADPQMKAALLRWLSLTEGLELIWGLKAFWKIFQRSAKSRWDEFDTGTKKWQTLKEKGSRLPLFCYWRGSPLTWLCRNSRRKDDTLIDFWLAATWGKPLSFGRLGFKEEPGKIRVFAMVNILTQALMYPLHEWIFSKLRLLPTDGTFNQTRPVDKLIKRFKTDGHWVASYDLSAATDRLPLRMQVALLVPLLGYELPFLWAQLLVGRPYRLPKIAKSYNLGYDSVSYSVGQPMGALSSWAMLALTHHALVQYAAHQAYPNEPGWFMDYAVLGDDVVIADRAVAAKYLCIMKSIGVEISLAKSLVSNTGSLEFAKRTWIQGQDASPISLAEMLVALTHLGALAELVRKNMKFGVIRVSSVARFAGFGFRNLARLPVVLGVGNRLTGLIAYLCRPGGEFPMPLEAWLSSVAPGGTDKGILDTRQWAVAQRLWSVSLRNLLNRLVKFDKLLYQISGTFFTDLKFWAKPKQGYVQKDSDVIRYSAVGGKKVKQILTDFFAPSVKEIFSLDAARVEWNEFFTEWVVRPYTNRLRASFEKIDDLLRVHEPGILPEWRVLEDVWKQVLESEEGVNALPTRVEFCRRENDEIAPSTRLITLWRRLRSQAIREATPSVSLRAGFVDAPKARRRRRGG